MPATTGAARGKIDGMGSGMPKPNQKTFSMVQSPEHVIARRGPQYTPVNAISRISNAIHKTKMGTQGAC